MGKNALLAGTAGRGPSRGCARPVRHRPRESRESTWAFRGAAFSYCARLLHSVARPSRPGRPRRLLGGRWALAADAAS